jgi:hypothetical protein
MNALAKILVREAAEARNEVDADTFVTVALCCAIGLLASRCTIYGPDLDMETIVGFS